MTHRFPALALGTAILVLLPGCLPPAAAPPVTESPAAGTAVLLGSLPLDGLAFPEVSGSNPGDPAGSSSGSGADSGNGSEADGDGQSGTVAARGLRWRRLWRAWR